MKTAEKIINEIAFAQHRQRSAMAKWQQVYNAHMRQLIDSMAIPFHELHANPAVLLKPDGTLEPIPAEKLYKKTRSDSGAPIKKMEESP